MASGRSTLPSWSRGGSSVPSWAQEAISEAGLSRSPVSTVPSWAQQAIDEAHGKTQASGHHGGILGGIESVGHAVGSKLSLAGHDIKSIPGGIIDQAQAEYSALKQTVEHPIVSKKKFKEMWEHPARPVAGTANTPQVTAAGKALIQGSVESLKHPLRDPFQTLMTVAPLVHGAGEAVGRAGAVSDAVKTGEGVKGAARAAMSKAPIGPRLVKTGEAQVPLHASANPAVRVAQGLYDKVIQHALDTNPEGRAAAHANRRVGGSVAETNRYQQRMREAPAASLEQAARRLPKNTAAGKVPRKLQEAALRLTSENSTPEEAAQFHRSQAAAGVSPKDNLRQARLYDAVAAKRLVTQDEHGNAVINAAAHPELAKVDAQVAAGQDQVDAIAKEHGLLTDEQAQARKNGPARIRNGASYETPTPAKAGIPSQALLKHRSRVTRLQAAHDRATAKAAKGEFSAAQRKLLGDLRPSSADEAEIQSKLDAANKAVTALRKKLPEDSPEVQAKVREKTAWQKLQIARGDMEKAAQGLEGADVPSPDEIAARIDALQRDVAAERGERDPALVQALRSAESTSNKLRDARKAAEKGSRLDSSGVAYTSSGARLEPAGYARAQKLGAALSVAKDELQQMEAAAEARQQPTGIVGGETAREGRGFVSYRTSEPRAPKSAAAAASSPVVGKVKSFIGGKPFTGHGLEHGHVPDNTSRLVADHMRKAYRYVNTAAFRDLAAKTGAATKRSSRDVLVLKPGVTVEALAKEIADTEGMSIGKAKREAARRMKVTTEMKQAAGSEHSTLNELPDQQPETAGLEQYVRHIVPGIDKNFQADRAQAIGTPAPDGYTWVDKGVLGDLGKPSAYAPKGRVARGFDNVNSAVTAATVYFKVGHIGTRVLTNTATNIIQGSAAPGEIGKSVALWKQLTPLERQKALAAAGQHGYAAMPVGEGTGRITKGVAKAAKAGTNWWAKHADAPFRFNSIAYEARKAGFDTPAKFRDLLDKLENPHSHNMNAAAAAKVDWVAKRANREGIAYDRLNSTERNYVTKAFWFYPWTAGATRFAVNTLLEHPYKSAVIGSAGVQGRKTQTLELGDLPSYEQGLFRVGKSEGRGPLVADFSTFSPFATPAELLQVPSTGEAADFLNPGYAALLQLATRTNAYGEHTNNPVGDAVSSLFAPTPEAQILSAYLGEHQNQSQRMFHKTPLSALARAAAGPGLPRRINVTAAHSAAARERAGR